MREQDWPIKERAAQCTACERAFADGEEVLTLLVSEEDRYQRADLCAKCRAPEPPQGLVSSWMGRFKEPPPPQPEPLRKETAESLLRRLLEAEDPADRDVVFILAVMLERRRLFAEKQVQFQEEGKVRVYEHRGTGEVFIIPDPELKLAEIEEVQRKVVALLEGDARETGEEEAAAAPDRPETGSPS